MATLPVIERKTLWKINDYHSINKKNVLDIIQNTMADTPRQYILDVVSMSKQLGHSDIYRGIIKPTGYVIPLCSSGVFSCINGDTQVVAKSYIINNRSQYRSFINSLTVYTDGHIDENIKGKFYGVFFDNSNPHNYELFLIFEYFRYGTLRNIIHYTKPFTLEHLNHYSAEIIRLFEHLHECYTHGDIKMQNICIANNEEHIGEWDAPINSNVKYSLRLIDFDVCKRLDDETKSLHGTLQYMAPEVLLGFYNREHLVYRKYMDVWGIGVLLYILSEGKMPYRLPSVTKPSELKKDNRFDFFRLYNTIIESPPLEYTRFPGTIISFITFMCLSIPHEDRPEVYILGNLLRATGTY